MTLTLTDLASSTLVSDLKSQVHTYLGGSSVVEISKIKILSQRKPIPPSKKTLGEVLSDSTDAGKKDVEFGVMVMGGAPDPPPSAPTTLFAASQQQASGPVSEDAAREAASKIPARASDDQSTSTPMDGVEKSKSPPAVQPGDAIVKIVLATDGFWEDLQGFMEQRLKDSDQASKLSGIFRTAWESSQVSP
jgi:ubiquitin-like protein 4